MNYTIATAYLFRNSASQKFAKDMSSYARLVATWQDDVNALPSEADLQAVEADALVWWNDNFVNPPVVGFDTGLGFELGIDEGTQRLIGDLMAYTESAQGNGRAAKATYRVRDTQGATHDLTLQQAKTVALDYAEFIIDQRNASLPDPF